MFQFFPLIYILLILCPHFTPLLRLSNSIFLQNMAAATHIKNLKIYETYDRICLLVSLTENLLLVLCTGLPSRPLIINSGLITFNVSSTKEQYDISVNISDINLITDFYVNTLIFR